MKLGWPLVITVTIFTLVFLAGMIFGAALAPAGGSCIITKGKFRYEESCRLDDGSYLSRVRFDPRGID